MKTKINGFTSLGSLFIILIFVIAFFTASQVLPFFYYYYEFVGHMEAQAAKAGINTDAQIKKFLMEKAKELKLPLDNPEEDIKVNRIGNEILIQTQYEEVLYVDFGEGYSWDLWGFKFNPKVQRKI